MTKYLIRFTVIAIVCGSFHGEGFAACTNPTSTQHTGYDNNCHECVVCDYTPGATYLDCYYTEAQIACGNGSITCADYGFLVTTIPTTPEYSGWSEYGQYGCAPCPNVANGTSFGLYNRIEARIINATWSTTQRCVATLNNERTDGNGCKYTVTIRPNAEDCVNVYSTEELPAYSSMNINTYTATDGCNWEIVKKTYTYAPVGYGVSNNNTASATCAPCGSGKYSPNGSILCLNLPPNSEPNNSNNDGYSCVDNTYKGVDPFTETTRCIGCPMFGGFSYTSTIFGYAPDGAESVTACYMPVGADGMSGTNPTGTWEYTSSCPWTGGYNTDIWVTISNVGTNSSCSDCIANGVCSQYYGITGDAIGGCMYSFTEGRIVDTMALRVIMGCDECMLDVYVD